MEFPPDFKAFLSCLNRHAVEYVLVGGYAVAAHGYTRNTGDMDIFYGPGLDNARRLEDALAEFGFAVEAASLAADNVLFRMGVKPVMIELMNNLSGVTFGEVYTHRDNLELDDLDVPMIDLTRLRINKAASGRSKDAVDLQNLPES